MYSNPALAWLWECSYVVLISYAPFYQHLQIMTKLVSWRKTDYYCDIYNTVHASIIFQLITSPNFGCQSKLQTWRAAKNTNWKKTWQWLRVKLVFAFLIYFWQTSPISKDTAKEIDNRAMLQCMSDKTKLLWNR